MCTHVYEDIHIQAQSICILHTFVSINIHTNVALCKYLQIQEKIEL